MKTKVKIDTTIVNEWKLILKMKPDWPIISDERFLLSVGIGSETCTSKC